MTTHNEVKPYKCILCNTRCSTNSKLKQHIASVHEGKKPFKCNICDSSFAEKSNLKRHIIAVHDTIQMW